MEQWSPAFLKHPAADRVYRTKPNRQRCRTRDRQSPVFRTAPLRDGLGIRMLRARARRVTAQFWDLVDRVDRHTRVYSRGGGEVETLINNPAGTNKKPLSNTRLSDMRK